MVSQKNPYVDVLDLTSSVYVLCDYLAYTFNNLPSCGLSNYAPQGTFFQCFLLLMTNPLWTMPSSFNFCIACLRYEHKHRMPNIVKERTKRTIYHTMHLVYRLLKRKDYCWSKCTILSIDRDPPGMLHFDAQ